MGRIEFGGPWVDIGVRRGCRGDPAQVWVVHHRNHSFCLAFTSGIQCHLLIGFEGYKVSRSRNSKD